MGRSMIASEWSMTPWDWASTIVSALLVAAFVLFVLEIFAGRRR